MKVHYRILTNGFTFRVESWYILWPFWCTARNLLPGGLYRPAYFVTKQAARDYIYNEQKVNVEISAKWRVV